MKRGSTSGHFATCCLGRPSPLASHRSTQGSTQVRSRKQRVGVWVSQREWRFGGVKQVETKGGSSGEAGGGGRRRGGMGGDRTPLISSTEASHTARHTTLAHASAFISLPVFTQSTLMRPASTAVRVARSPAALGADTTSAAAAAGRGCRWAGPLRPVHSPPVRCPTPTSTRPADPVQTTGYRGSRQGASQPPPSSSPHSSMHLCSTQLLPHDTAWPGSLACLCVTPWSPSTPPP